jgi:hypothetical protein
MGLSYCVRLSTEMNYIDGGAGRPVTPADQWWFYFADVLTYVGYGILVGAFAMLAFSAIHYEWKE